MLAVLTTHPIQYQIPIWRALAARGRVPLKVFYMSNHGHSAGYDPGFGRTFAWDVDLLGGYNHELVKVVTGPSQSSFWWLCLAENIARRAKAEGAKALWLQGWQVAAYWQAVRQARAIGLELWLRGESNARSNGRTVLRRTKGQVLSLFLNRIDKFLYIGEANRDFYTSRGIPVSRLSPAPYCVENARFASQAQAACARRPEIRARWAIPENAFCVLFVGKLIPKKRPLDLVAAAAALGRRVGIGTVHLLFVGSGELDDLVRDACYVVHDVGKAISQSAEKGRPAASFVGFLNQSQIAEAYVAADCLALPSEATETWGLVANEAMACGLPVTVSDACGCSDDLVKPIRPDLCFPVGDIGAFADSLQACLERPPTVPEISSHIERYDFMRTVQTVETLYEAREGSRVG